MHLVHQLILAGYQQRIENVSVPEVDTTEYALVTPSARRAARRGSRIRAGRQKCSYVRDAAIVARH